MRRITGQGIALAVAAKARDIMEVHRIHTHPSKGITRKTTKAIRVETTGQRGPRADVRQSSSQGAALALAEKTAEAMKTARDQRGPCADVGRSPRHGAALAVAAKARDMMKIHHVLKDLEEETRGVPLDPKEETPKVALDPDEETREVPSDHEEETKGCSRANGVGRTGCTCPLKSHHQRDSSANNVVAHEEPTGAHSCGRRSVGNASAGDEMR